VGSRITICRQEMVRKICLNHEELILNDGQIVHSFSAVLLSFQVGLQSSCLNVVFIDATNTPVLYNYNTNISQ
jgi:hypothetical protein